MEDQRVCLKRQLHISFPTPSNCSLVLMKDNISNTVTEITKALLAVFMTWCNELFKCMKSCSTHSNERVHLFSVVVLCVTEKHQRIEKRPEHNRINVIRSKNSITCTVCACSQTLCDSLIWCTTYYTTGSIEWSAIEMTWVLSRGAPEMTNTTRRLLLFLWWLIKILNLTCVGK